MRRRFIFIFLPLLGLAAFFLRPHIESGTNRLVARWSARKALASWGLEPTRDNIDLYLSIEGFRPDAREESARFVAQSALPKPFPDDLRFSDRWTYRQLFEKSRISIGIYNLDPCVSNWLERISRDTAMESNRWLSIRWLRSREDLVQSFARDTLVLYFGHANVGRGIVFEGRGREAPISMGRDRLEVPRNHLSASDVVVQDLGDGFARIQGGSQGLEDLRVNCKVFGYFGCRTDQYFREIWEERFPSVDFIATTYVCHTTGMAPEILLHLVRGLHEGRTLGQIVDALNQGQSSAILFGRMKETSQYRNPGSHADNLFTY